jgi:hypothetical protein
MTINKYTYNTLTTKPNITPFPHFMTFLILRSNIHTCQQSKTQVNTVYTTDGRRGQEKPHFKIYFFMTSMFRLAAILDGPPSRTKKAGEREWGKPRFKIYFFISMVHLAAILNEPKWLDNY